MDTGASTLRHAVLGAANALALSVRALQLPMSPAEQVEFLDDILVSSDRLLTLLDQFEALTPAE